MITVITPSLNAAATIGDCIRSVMMQGASHEHIVVDGHSTDGSPEKALSIDPAIRLFVEPANGIYAAINRGIEEARGGIVAVLNADDFYVDADVLGRVSGVFEDGHVDACYGDLCYVERANPQRIVRYWRAGGYRKARLRHGWMPPHPTFFLKRAIYEKHGVYRTDLGSSADYELMLRMLLKENISAEYLPETLVHMRTGGASNASLAARIEANRMDREAWRVNGLRPYPWTLLTKPLRKVGQWWRRPDRTASF
jgi:glycosyltransferase